MKRTLVIISIVTLVFVCIDLVLLDKQYFLCPIEYKSDILIRNDNRGDGLFAASRSGRRMHKGLDLMADVGEAVLAAKSGKVISATQNQGMGKYVIIRHAHNYITIYGHLSEILVQKNDFVHQGQIVGKVGKTGNARYRDMLPHLHFEIRKDGIPQDPLDYI
jgi:murein DD-endopeptidase MepM/ murein hydrolase activator NlpD